MTSGHHLPHTTAHQRSFLNAQTNPSSYHTHIMSNQPQPQSQLKLLANYSVTGFLLSTGLFALLAPTTFAAGFGMPISPDTFASGFVQCMGGRNLTFGIIASMFLQRRDFGAVATMATLLAVDGAIDGLVCLKYAGWVHAAPHFGAAVGIPFVANWMRS